MLEPAGRTRQRPCGQQPPIFGGATQPTVQAAPAPLFGPARQVGPQRVSLDVPGDGKQMLVFLDRKGLEASLINMPRADGLSKHMPALRVRERQPADELRQFT